MTAKLTLSINEEAVKKAKRISQSRGKSVSKMVEEFIYSLPEKEKQNPIQKIREIMAPYKDKIILPENADYKEMIQQWRYEDYMEGSKENKAISKKSK